MSTSPESTRATSGKKTLPATQPPAVSISLTETKHPVTAEPTAEERRELIATAAYYLAEKRGFEAGHEMEDWLAAEASLADASVSSPEKK